MVNRAQSQRSECGKRVSSIYARHGLEKSSLSKLLILLKATLPHFLLGQITPYFLPSPCINSNGSSSASSLVIFFCRSLTIAPLLNSPPIIITCVSHMFPTGALADYFIKHLFIIRWWASYSSHNLIRRKQICEVDFIIIAHFL